MISWLAALALAGTWEVDEPGEPIPDRPFDLQHLDLAVRLDLDEGTVLGEVTVQARRRAAGDLQLHQRDLDIREVRVDGQPARHHLRPDRVVIPIPPDAAEATVVVRYAATPRAGLHFRGLGDAPAGEPVLAWSQGEDEDHRHWFPSWDHPSDRFTVTTHVEVRSGLGAWAPGTPLGATPTDDGWTRHSFALEQPVVNYLVAVAAGDYHEVAIDSGPLPTGVLVPKGSDPSAWVELAGPTGEVVDWLARTLDEPFPYPRYLTVAAPRFLYGGMENPGFVTLEPKLLREHPDDDPIRGRRIVAHEAAHQWFGDLVTTYGWRHLWLNEGFASYWAERWVAEAHDDSVFAERLRHWHDRSLSSDAPVVPRTGRFDGRDHAKQYVQGASLLHFLDGELGRDAFDAGIQAYLDRHQGQLVETDDLRRVLEDHTGRSLGPWFEHFLHREGHATLASTWSWADGTVEISVTQPDGPDDRPPVVLPLQVTVAAADGSVQHHRWRVAGGSTRWVLPLEAPPRWIAVDPEGRLLARWTREQPVEAWSAQASEAPTAFARLEALTQLGKRADDEASIQALLDALTDRTRPPTERAAAAQALGHVPLSRAADALAAATTDHPTVARAAVQALAHHADYADLSVIQARVRARDSEVDALALLTLATLAPADAASQARQWLRRPDRSGDHRFHARAIDALAKVDDPAYLPSSKSLTIRQVLTEGGTLIPIEDLEPEQEQPDQP